jgi:hypothetical protein
MTGWADTVRAADKLQEEHPGWRVRAVPRRAGPGVAAVRDSSAPGLCTVIGTAAEVRAVLTAEPQGMSTATRFTYGCDGSS